MSASQIANRIDKPATPGCFEIRGERPLVGLWTGSVETVGTFKIHAPSVVTDARDQGKFRRGQLFCRKRGKIVNLGFDWPSSSTYFLDQSGNDALDRSVLEVPGTGELQQREIVKLCDRAERIEFLASVFDPTERSKRSMI